MAIGLLDITLRPTEEASVAVDEQLPLGLADVWEAPKCHGDQGGERERNLVGKRLPVRGDAQHPGACHQRAVAAGRVRARAVRVVEDGQIAHEAAAPRIPGRATDGRPPAHGSGTVAAGVQSRARNDHDLLQFQGEQARAGLGLYPIVTPQRSSKAS